MDAPAELKTVPQWIVWRDENGRKVPYQPNGAKAKTNDRTTWHTWDACQVAGFSGPGFVFSESDPFCGIDLDGCYHEGQIAPWASEILDLFTGRYYAEISPSGKGIKLWVRARLPDGRGRKHSLADKQGIEIYDRGRYFTFTGQSLAEMEIDDAQAAVNTILSRFFPVKQYASHAHHEPVGDIGRRVAAYMAKVPPAVSGSDGHGQTIRAAAILVRGFCLTPEAAYNHLAAWNERCEPPWSDPELWHKINDAAKHEGERGWLLNGNRYSGPDVDLSRLLASVQEEPEENDGTALPENPVGFPTWCLEPPGLLGEIVRHNLRTAMWPQPELALGAAIALVGVITGRKIQDDRRTRTNVYVLGLAASGAGKEHARQLNKELLMLAGGEKMLGPESVASSAGLAKSVESQPAILFQLDEIARLLETMRHPGKSPHLYKIGSVLMTLDSQSGSRWIGDAYANQKQIPMIDQPHACIYGTAVPDGFWESLTIENVSKGFLGRLLVFESAIRYPEIQAAECASPSDSLVSAVRWWVDYRPATSGNLGDQHPTPTVVPYEAPARARINAHLRGICDRRKNEDDVTAALWTRTTGRTARLALIHAASRQTGEMNQRVDVCDVDWAIAVSNWLTRRMVRQVHRHVAENDWERSVKRMLRVLDRPLTGSQLTRRTQWLRGRERDEMLATLIQSGQVTVETVTGKTKPTTVYSAWKPQK